MKIYDQYFDKVKNKVPTLQIYMESPRKNIVYQYADTYSDQRYHSASIGKLFCATLVFMAIEEKLCSLETKIK
jgi:D-alanyl-D-alanine carboxypeptidase